MTDSSELAAAFAQATTDAYALDKRPDNDTLLRLYALYKQGSEGDNTAAKPSFTDLVARAKWQAWTSLAGTPREQAIRDYVALVAKLRDEQA